MSTAPFHFIWAEKNIEYHGEFTDFRSIVGDAAADSSFLCAKFDPPLISTKNTRFETINFSDFQFQFRNQRLTFDTPENIVLNVKRLNSVTVTIVRPSNIKQYHNHFLIFFTSLGLFPIPEDCNEDLRDSSDECFMHLFYFDHKKEKKAENVKFKCSFRSPWSQLPETIESKLIEFDLGRFGISIGFLRETDAFPKLIPLKDAFKTTDNGKRAMIAIASSFKECKIRLMFYFIFIVCFSYAIYW